LARKRGPLVRESKLHSKIQARFEHPNTCSKVRSNVRKSEQPFVQLVDLNDGSLTSGDFVYLRANNGDYLSAENGGGSIVDANRVTPRDWETFKVLKIGGSGVIQIGDQISLQTKPLGLYFSANNGGGSGLTADRTAVSGWEAFELGGSLGAGNVTSGSGNGWALSWSDEFNGSAGAIDGSKWGFETGGSGWGNNELEYYTNRTDNAALDGNGSLVITAKAESYGGRNYTSARINSSGKFTQAYGRMEARIQIPRGEGIWPAFWMFGANIGSVGWPQCGEIDIMENVGKEPTVNHGSLHGPGYSGANPLTAIYTAPSALADAYHVYAVEWEPNQVRFYVDGTLYETRTPANIPAGTTWVYDHPFYVILNVAVGGTFPGSPDGSTKLPQEMKVDYVRVYTKSTDSGTTTTGTTGVGPNVMVFDPSMAIGDIKSKVDAIYNQMDANQFGTQRYALLFKPGTYPLDVKVGFYTQVLGLGQSPDDAVINGDVRVKGDWMPGNNSTCNFWRGAENLSSTPTPAIDDNTNIWAVSQGTQMRRFHIRGALELHDYGGWTSGGFIADTLVDGILTSGSQQQFITRNNEQNWTGGVWNMVFVGDSKEPAASWPAPPYSITHATPRVREKPFLFVNDAGQYLVMVPKLKINANGRSWTDGSAPGVALSMNQFYVAKPSDNAASMNAALAAGKHLLLTPGIYHLDSSLKVTQPGAIILGIGLPTLIVDNDTAAVSVDDIDNVTLAGFVMEAGPTNSATLLQVGAGLSSRSHAAFPTLLADVHCRVGGADPGLTDSCVVINSNDVIIDNMWLWRADHGAGAGWTSNKSANGIIVNGTNVTAYGLFVEHFQQYQTLWNGNNGAVYMYQSEMPYDPPNQLAWSEGGGRNGFPSYKVADTVQTHYAEGLGVYSVFTNSINAFTGIEAPVRPGVTMTHMVTANLAQGSVTHIFNDAGGQVDTGTMTAYSGN
jgi:beta-glucanase (GH16 family)